MAIYQNLSIIVVLGLLLSLQTTLSTDPPLSPPSSPPLPFSSPPPTIPSPVPSPSPSSKDDTSKKSPSPAPTPASSPAPEGSSDGGGETVKNVKAGEEEREGGRGMSGGKKAGIALGVIGAFCVVGVAGFVYNKRQQNLRRSEFSYGTRRDML